MGGSKTGVWIAGAVVAAVLTGGTVGTLYAMRAGPFKAVAPATAAKSDLARFAVGPLTALETPAALEPATDHVFKTREGTDVRLADFRGRVVVVNLWAMWCAPCKAEMPTLVTLATAYAERDLMVLPVNVDTGAEAIADAARFIDGHAPLPLYSDPTFQLPFEFSGKGKMPQTILLDRRGRVRAVYAGGANWAGPEARALIDALLSESD